MVYHCSYGVCNSDVRYGPKGKRPRQDMDGVTWHTFPPKKEMSRRRRWVEACGREGYTVDNLIASSAICSKHFVGGKGPTAQHPDPIPADYSRQKHVYYRLYTGRASRRKQPKAPPDVIELPAPETHENNAKRKPGRPKNKPNILSRSSALTVRSTKQFLEIVKPAEQEDDVIVVESSAKRPRLSTKTNKKNPTQPSQKRAQIQVYNILTGQNDHLQSVNSQLKEDNAKLREQINQCKNVITKFISIRKEMGKLGMGLPKAPQPQSETTTHYSTSPTGSATISGGIQGNRVLGDMRVLGTVSEQEQIYINIEPIEDNPEIKYEQDGESSDYGCSEQVDGQMVLDGGGHQEVPSPDVEAMYRQAALNYTQDSDNMVSSHVSELEEFMIQTQPNGDQVLVCVKSTKEQLTVKPEPGDELMT